MSEQEKASWSLLIINVIIGAWYFSTVFEMGTDVLAQMRVLIALLIKVTLLAIVLGILGEVLMHWLAGRSRDKVARDERDQLINLKAQRNGYFVLAAALIALLHVLLAVALGMPERIAERSLAISGFLEKAGTAIFMANLVLLALVVTEVAVQGSRIFYYRRGH